MDFAVTPAVMEQVRRSGGWFAPHEWFTFTPEQRALPRWSNIARNLEVFNERMFEMGEIWYNFGYHSEYDWIHKAAEGFAHVTERFTTWNANRPAVTPASIALAYLILREYTKEMVTDILERRRDSFYENWELPQEAVDAIDDIIEAGTELEQEIFNNLLTDEEKDLGLEWHIQKGWDYWFTEIA